MIELMQKNMIPTLYDYWVNDVDVLREKGKYELYPHNPYEDGHQYPAGDLFL